MRELFVHIVTFQRWGNSLRRLPADLLRFIRAYPLFAVAVVVFAAFVCFAAWVIVRDFVSPKKFVIVEFHAVDMQLTANDVTVSIERVAFRPGYKVRLGTSLLREGDPELMLDGYVTNNSAQWRYWSDWLPHP